MDDLLTIADLERLRNERGLSIRELSRRAGLATSIFVRWKSGKMEPTLKNYRALRDAILSADPAAAAADRPLAIVEPAASRLPHRRNREV